MARGFKVADAYVELTIDKDELRRGAAAIPGEVGPQLDKAGSDMGKRLGKSLGDESTRQGDDAGGKLALGMRMSIIRNSPLIVAAVGAALAAGAPAMLTAATGLFAGIGIVAAAQSQLVQRAWLGTWQSIRDGAIADARPIEGVLVNLAGRVSEAFQDLRPALQGIFADVAPQIDVFARGMLGLVTNVMPGFQRAIANSMPVTEGFAAFLEKTGTGLSNFFDRITAHAPAAGQVWSSLGDSMAELLPLLGELLGQGAELAATVLPLLSGALGLVLDAVTALGPALPLVTAGFAAWKIVGTIGPLFERLSVSLGTAAASGGVFAGTAGKMSGALSGLSAAAGPLAIGVAAWAAIFAKSESQIRGWAAALNEGGDAARQAREDMSGYDNTMGKIGTVLDTTAAKTNVFTAATSWAWEKLSNDTDEAREAHDAYLASLIPTERAARDVSIAQRELADAIGEHGANSPKAQAAQERLTTAERIARDVADEHARAIEGVTEAMMAQADQSRAMVDANFAYQDSLNGVEDAQAALAEAQAHLNDADDSTRTSMEDVSRAAEDLNKAYSDQARAAGELAMSELPASLDDTQRAAFGAKAELDELNALVAMGVVLPDWMERHRQSLERTASQADETMLATAAMSAAVTDAGYAVANLPDGKGVTITGIEPETINPLRDGLRNLGFDIVTLPDNKGIEVRALTEQAVGNIGMVDALLVALGLKTAEPQVTVNPQPVIDGANVAGAAVDALGAKSANPYADLSDDPLVMKALADQGLLTNLGSFGATPWADLYDDPLQVAVWEDQGLLSDLNVTNAVPTADLADQALLDKAGSDLNYLGILDGSRPTPLADIQDDPLYGTYLQDMGLLGNLAGQTPTPVGFLDDGPARGTVNSLMGRLGEVAGQRPTPIAAVMDFATGPLMGIKRWLDSLYNKTVTVTTVEKRIAGGATVNSLGLAGGGNVGKAVRGFAPGGSPSRRSDGRLVGPGGPLDDLIPAITNMGEAIRVANDEWIVPGAVGYKQGEARMAALVAGQADIVPRRFDRGGPIDERSRSSVADNRPVIISINGTFDLASSRELRRAAEVMHAEFRQIERARS